MCSDIAAATDSDPARRLADAAELAGRLRTLPDRHAARARAEAEALAAERLRSAHERNRARRPWVIAAMVVLGVGATCSSLLWWHSERQRHIAQQQAARAEAVVRFLDHALGTISTGNSGHGNDPTIRDMLEYASAPGSGTLPHDPEVRGDIHTLLGRSWRYLGDPARGVAEYRTAVHGYTQAFGESHELTLSTRYALVRTLSYVQTAQAFAEAGALLDDTDRLAGARLLRANMLALQAAVERGIHHVQRMQVAPALDALRRADQLQREISPDDAGLAVLVRTNLAEALRQAGKPGEALAWIHAAQADPLLARERIGEVNHALLQSTVARALYDLGRHAEAAPLAIAALDTSTTYLGRDNYLALVQRSMVASLHAATGDCAAALPLARGVQQRMALNYGEDMQATLVAAGRLGEIELRCGDREGGLQRIRVAEHGLRARFGDSHPVASALGALLSNAHHVEADQQAGAEPPKAVFTSATAEP